MIEPIVYPKNLDKKWKWLVTAYYNDTVKPPKYPGELAIQVGCADDTGKDLELRILEKRKDIGKITVEIDHRHDNRI